MQPMCNMVPTSAKDAAVPFELLTGKQADTSGLRKFGCAAFVHVERESRRKWDNKARRGVYVGFSLQSKTNLVYFANTKSLVESMHCDFNEDQQAAVAVGEEGLSAATSAAAGAAAAGGGIPISIDVLQPASIASPPLLLPMTTPVLETVPSWIQWLLWLRLTRTTLTPAPAALRTSRLRLTAHHRMPRLTVWMSALTQS